MKIYCNREKPNLENFAGRNVWVRVDIKLSYEDNWDISFPDYIKILKIRNGKISFISSDREAPYISDSLSNIRLRYPLEVYTDEEFEELLNKDMLE